MFPRVTTIASVILSLLILLFLVLLFLGRCGPIPPSPEILVFVNDKELHTIKQPLIVNVKKGELIQVKIQAYYQGELIEPGEFTYQWCFTPEVNNNLYCLVDGYRAETNSDYRPEDSTEQELKITIKHDFLKAPTVTVLFRPE